LLEVQTADRISWLPNREIVWNDDAVEIQTIHSHLRQVEPSHLISGLGHDTLYRLLPPSIRSCIRAYGLLRKWLISKIVEPKLGLRARQSRMDLLLRAIEVARLRSTEASSSPLSVGEMSCTRSFVEAVLSSAVLSIESRMHQRPWQNLAISRGVQCDTLASFLAKPCIKSISSKSPLTVDIGWLIERMLEIATTPDIVTSSSVEAPQNLVNFDKRRCVYYFLLYFLFLCLSDTCVTLS
jgi:GTPase-activating protein BEM2